MNPRVPFIAAICCVIPLAACKKPAQTAEKPKEQSLEEYAKSDEAKGSRLLGEIRAGSGFRGYKVVDIDLLKKDYERLKERLNTASSTAALERAKLEAMDARDKLAKAQAEYDKMLAEDKEKLAEAKRLLGDKYTEDDAEILKDMPFDPNTSRK